MARLSNICSTEFCGDIGRGQTACRGMSYVEQEQTEELVSPYVPRMLTL